LYFGKDDKIKGLLFEFKKAAETDQLKDSILVKLLYTLCRKEGYKHLSREDINNVFQKGC